MLELIVTLVFMAANPLSGVDQTLMPYFDSFASEIGAPAIEIPAGFANLEELEPGVIGVCITIGEDKFMYFDQAFWDKANEDQRKALVNHELGHCALDLPHDNTQVDECPASLMYPSLTSNYCLTEYPERYSPTALVNLQ